MARPGITYQEVATAADGIVTAGENPTIQRVRMALGNTGSPNTIHKHLTAWREAAPVQERKTPKLPEELQAAMVKEIERQAAGARAELEKQLIQAQEEAAELAGTGEQLETAMEELTEQNQSLSEENQKLKALTEERAKEVATLRAERDREYEKGEGLRMQLATGLSENTAQGERIITLTADMDKIGTELTSVTASKIAAEQAAAVAEAKYDGLKERFDQQVQQQADQKTEFEQRLSDQAAETDKLEQELKQQIKEVRADYKQRLDELKKALEQKDAEVVTARAAAAKLSGELRSLRGNSAE